MNIFESEISSAKIIKRGILKILLFLFLFNTICIIVSNGGEKNNDCWMVFDGVIALQIGLNAIRKRNRNIFKIIFDDDNKNVSIEFSKYFFKTEKALIPFEELSFYFGRNLYGRGAFTMTLTFNKNEKYLAEIKLISNTWDWEKVKEIHEKLKPIAKELKHPLN